MEEYYKWYLGSLRLSHLDHFLFLGKLHCLLLFWFLNLMKIYLCFLPISKCQVKLSKNLKISYCELICKLVLWSINNICLNFIPNCVRNKKRLKRKNHIRNWLQEEMWFKNSIIVDFYITFSTWLEFSDCSSLLSSLSPISILSQLTKIFLC